jgi:hypothetical protein
MEVLENSLTVALDIPFRLQPPSTAEICSPIACRTLWPRVVAAVPLEYDCARRGDVAHGSSSTGFSIGVFLSKSKLSEICDNLTTSSKRPGHLSSGDKHEIE